jgi:uncharacterized protein (TIGR02996 family)
MATVHPDADALYRAILAHPDEDTPRLVYADWLDEHGDHDRAEFIRVQCRLARMNEWDDDYTADRIRATRLLHEHKPKWLERPAESDLNRRGLKAFARGFLSDARVGYRMTEEEIRQRFARFPIATAFMVFTSEWPGPLFEPLTSPSLPHLRRIGLGFHNTLRTATEACRTLARAEYRSGLTHLDIWGDPTLEGLEAVITSPNLRNLETLSLN